MRRDKLKILISILEICDKGSVNKTKIVYGSNLNFKVAGMYLNMLIREGLVRVTNAGPREKYFTTEEGKEVLSNVRGVYERIEHYHLE
jgi:predicted transcriptional regulator